MTQRFKGDDIEEKYYQAGMPIFNYIGINKDAFFNGAYTCIPLGEMLYDTARSPLANAILREIFADSFTEIYDAFQEAGTFESYLTVFRKIFGDDVVVEFEIPSPGVLNIDIEATGIQVSDLLARSIVDNEYIFDEIVDHESDNIAVRTIKGFSTQYEVEQMLKEMVPAGIFTNISLTIGA